MYLGNQTRAFARGYWILVGQTPIEVDATEWSKWFSTHLEERVIAQESVKKYYVSTVFIGIDSRSGVLNDPIPVLFETMIFGTGKYNDWEQRYRSYVEAEDGHKEIVRRLKARKPLDR